MRMQNSAPIRSFLLILFSAALTLPPSSQAAAQMKPAQIDSTALKLAEALQSRVIPLDRETLTFHYLAMQETPQIQSKAQILDWAGSIADNFYNVSVTSGDLQGIGLYNAIDPHSSRSYGDPYPVLFALPLRKGTIVLDLVGERPDDETTVETLRSLAEPCREAGGNNGISSVDDVTRAFRNSNDLDCRSVVIRAHRKLGIQAILYSYSADQFSVGCRMRSDSFNVIDRAALGDDFRNVGLFWEGGRFADSTLTRFVGQTYQDVPKDFFKRYEDLFHDSPSQILGSLKNSGTFERSAQSWRKRNLLRCGSTWSIEGHEAIQNVLIYNLRDSFTDKEIQNTILDWHRAYRAKIDSKTYDLSSFQRIHAIEREVYLQTGLPRDFSKFEAWTEVSDGYFSGFVQDTDSDSRAENLLGEPGPQISNDEVNKRTRAILHEIFTPSHAQPGLYGEVLKRLGYGPLISRLKVGMWISLFGGMPILATPLPTDARTDAADLMAVNKIEFLKILRRCTDLMNDPTVTAEVVQNTDCGVRQKHPDLPPKRSTTP